MKIVLQQTGTALYFRSLEMWTSSPQEALDFFLSERAVNFIAEQHLSEVEVVAFPENGAAETSASSTPTADPPPRAEF